jgi:glycosyltransferase involved in cell wall biosynthesis
LIKPLVSILIPAYNAKKTIACTIQSAIAQTWQRKEIIVIDDGSTDRTAEIAWRFGAQVTVVSTKNQGLSAALNLAIGLSRGDYIQELDSDDILTPSKIERQLAALRETDSKRILLSSPWAPFYHRTRHARFVRNSLWEDLSPVEWLLKKMGENLHMQNATWLVSRELAEAAGPWDTDLHYDQDGDYFARVLLASEGTRFVPGAGVFYRSSGTNSISYIGNSNKKKDSLLRSLKLHIKCLRSLEESERVRKVCLTYLQNWYYNFYPERPDIIADLQSVAAQLQGRLEEPRLRRRYAWMKPVFGWNAAKWAQSTLPQFKASCFRQCDKAMYTLENAQRRPRFGRINGLQ